VNQPVQPLVKPSSGTSTTSNPLGQTTQQSTVGTSSESSLDSSLLPGVNVLLEGPTGTGKTHSIGTLVDTGVEVFFEALESGQESLLGYFTDQGRDIPPNLHWHSMSTVAGGFAALAKTAQDIGNNVQETLYKMQDMQRGQRNYFYNLLAQLNNFHDDRTGQKFGAVDSWGPNRALVLDGLTGLGTFAMALVVGQKPVRSQTDWGIAQDQVEKILKLLTDGCKCHFVLISHVEREVDQVMGGVKVTVASLGKALPPKIPPMFSDVILTERKGTNWTWSTANPLCDLKTRNLPVAENIPPTFQSIIDKWQSRGGRFAAKVKT